MNYAAGATIKNAEETEVYLPSLLFILPITKEDFNKQNGINEIFIELCTENLKNLPADKRALVVIQKVSYGYKRLKAVKANLPLSCQNHQDNILETGIGCGNKTVWPVRNARTFKFLPCTVSIRFRNALPNLTADEIRSEINLPEGINTNNETMT